MKGKQERGHKCCRCKSQAYYFDNKVNEFFCENCVNPDFTEDVEEINYTNSPRDGVCGGYGKKDNENPFLSGNKAKFEKGKDLEIMNNFTDDKGCYDYDEEVEFDEDDEFDEAFGDELTDEFIELIIKKREYQILNWRKRIAKGKFTEDLKELLECNTKEDLTTLANMLSISKISSLNKSKLIEKLTEEYQSKVGEFLKILDLERYEFLKSVVNKDVIKVEDCENNFMEYYMECGLVFPFVKEDDIYFIMPNEVREEVESFNNIDNIKLLKENSDLVRLCWGMTQYYGGFLLNDFMVMANDYCKFNWNKIRVDEVLKHSSLYYLRFEVLGNICKSMALNDVGSIVCNNTIDLPYCHISKKEFLEACNERYIFENKINSGLRRYLNRYWKVEAEALDMFILELYMDIQEREPHEIIKDVMNEFQLDEGPIYNGLLRELNNVIYNTRLWKLKGHTLNQFRNDLKENAKVGRNDSCPCGSGKKYKNCCASNVINLF